MARGGQSIVLSLTGNGTAGRPAGEGGLRGIGTAGLGMRVAGIGARGELTYGAVTATAPAWERFAVGGARTALVDGALLSQRVPLPAARFGVVRGDEVMVARLSGEVGGLTPYVVGARSGAGVRGWYRVAGAEVSFETPSFNVLRIPALRVLSGIGYPLDSPDRRRLQFYGTITYRP